MQALRASTAAEAVYPVPHVRVVHKVRARRCDAAERHGRGDTGRRRAEDDVGRVVIGEVLAPRGRQPHVQRAYVGGGHRQPDAHHERHHRRHAEGPTVGTRVERQARRCSAGAPAACWVHGPAPLQLLEDLEVQGVTGHRRLLVAGAAVPVHGLEIQGVEAGDVEPRAGPPLLVAVLAAQGADRALEIGPVSLRVLRQVGVRLRAGKEAPVPVGAQHARDLVGHAQEPADPLQLQGRGEEQVLVADLQAAAGVATLPRQHVAGPQMPKVGSGPQSSRAEFGVF
mmetsp:Transcript_106798/g.302007  ORF Transcript_106798/g.302007 Transcript_106798/m.302007 type:complete len:283 (-) Transcript_106798:897-1745(-)